MQANYYFLCKIGAIQPMSGEILGKSSENPIDSQIRDLLQPLDIFALLMASIGHDVGHPGVNNNFMVIVINPRKEIAFINIYCKDNNIYTSCHSI